MWYKRLQVTLILVDPNGGINDKTNGKGVGQRRSDQFVHRSGKQCPIGGMATWGNSIQLPMLDAIVF